MDNLITKYQKSWNLLFQYDENTIQIKNNHPTNFIIDHQEAIQNIQLLKQFLVSKNEASNLFGIERENGFKALINNINQTFSKIELFQSVEEKSANLLYYIVKDHPFIDGNKRIGAFIFVLFLEKNNLLTPNLNDITLSAITLLVANSNPNEKELMINFITQII